LTVRKYTAPHYTTNFKHNIGPEYLLIRTTNRNPNPKDPTNPNPN